MRLLATAGRVLSQLRRDPRTVAMMVLLPMLLVGLFAWIMPARQFDTLGPMLIALFPFTVMDLILRLAEDRLLGFVWTDELLTEWERVIVEDGHEPRNQPRQWQPRSERLSPTADALGFRG